MNILLICGGDGSEHSVSLVSANYLMKQMSMLPKVNVTQVIIHNNFWETNNNHKCYLSNESILFIEGFDSVKIDYVIPCIHGFPGETGDLQSYLEMIHVPYLGCNSESSKLCYNKISTKLWLDGMGIPNTPYVFISDKSSESLNKAIVSFDLWGPLFIKASSEGSSVGCYKVNDRSQIIPKIFEAFKYSDRVLIEKAEKARELEVAVFEYGSEIIVTDPGEIIFSTETFYSYDEKYGSKSSTTTDVVAKNLTNDQRCLIKELALKAFKNFKLKDLSRIDFFLTNDNKIYINEINTFPGMTSTSLFPKMMTNVGITMSSYLENRFLRYDN